MKHSGSPSVNISANESAQLPTPAGLRGRSGPCCGNFCGGTSLLLLVVPRTHPPTLPLITSKKNAPTVRPTRPPPEWAIWRFASSGVWASRRLAGSVAPHQCAEHHAHLGADRGPQHHKAASHPNGTCRAGRVTGLHTQRQHHVITPPGLRQLFVAPALGCTWRASFVAPPWSAPGAGAVAGTFFLRLAFARLGLRAARHRTLRASAGFPYPSRLARSPGN